MPGNCPPGCQLGSQPYYWPTYDQRGWGAYTRTQNQIHYQNWQDPFAFLRQHVATVADHPMCDTQTTFARCPKKTN
jgi:hypothetical protein